MFPFDSPVTIIPLAIIAVILVLYTVLLIKLKPPNETIESTEKDSIKPKKLETPVTSAATVINASEEATPTIQEEPSKAVETKAVESKIVETRAVETKAKELSDGIEEQKMKSNKDKDSKKSFFLFGERNFAGCPHKFGYLKTLRKNAPIPDECFGCPQILECLMTQTGK